MLRIKFRMLRSKIDPPEIISESVFPNSLQIIAINLEERRDRWRQLLGELERVGANQIARFDAVKNPRGSLGCARSHLSALSTARDDGRLILICEDDLEFIASLDEIENAIEAFVRDDSLDVLCLANNPQKSILKINQLLAVTSDTQTTACYLLKPRAKKRLISSFRRSANLLARGYPDSVAAPDQIWKKTQRRNLVFAVPLVRLAKQRASFSDIEGRWVDYGV